MIKKQLKRLICMVTSVIMIMGMFTNAFANSEQNSDSLAVLKDGTKVVAAYRFVNGEFKEMTREEYAEYRAKKELIEKDKNNVEIFHKYTPIINTIQGGVPFTTYEEIGVVTQYPREDLRKRISNIVNNNGTKDAEMKISGSYTQGVTSTYSLTSGEKSAVVSEVGISFSTQYSFSQEITSIIPPKHKGWMEFTPLMYNSYGHIIHGITLDVDPWYYVTSKTWTNIYFPVRLPNGQLDGIYEIMEAPL